MKKLWEYEIFIGSARILSRFKKTKNKKSEPAKSCSRLKKKKDLFKDQLDYVSNFEKKMNPLTNAADSIIILFFYVLL